MPSKRTSLALSLTGTPWMLRCGSYLWTWDYHGKRNKSTVLWKRLRIDIWGAIGVCLYPTVCPRCAVLCCLLHSSSSQDHPYILAFSLIMLHTDAFNKSNKRKMTKADYIKNTQLAGIFPEVLEVRERPVSQFPR